MFGVFTIAYVLTSFMPWEYPDIVDSRVADEQALGARWIELQLSDGSAIVVLETRVTVEQWKAVTGVSLGDFYRDYALPQSPAIAVSIFDQAEFANRISDIEGVERCYDMPIFDTLLSGADFRSEFGFGLREGCNGFRLPTPAELAMLRDAEPLASDASAISHVQWCGYTAKHDVPHGAFVVAQKWPTPHGIFDLFGAPSEIGVAARPILDPNDPRMSISRVFQTPEAVGWSVVARAGPTDAQTPCRIHEVVPPVFPLDIRRLSLAFRLVRRYEATPW